MEKLLQQSDEPEAQKASGVWRIHWRSPTSMIGLFIGATGAAVAHHLYYDNIDGSEVVIVQDEWTLEAVRNSQEWKLRFGAGLAFLAKAMFAASAIVAYEQQAWLTARTKAAVAGLDAMFSAAQSPLSFFSPDFLRKAKARAIMALLVWCIPLAAVITPGTLVVVPTTLSTSKSFPVPVINFSQVLPLYDFNSSVIGYVATSSQILPMNIGLANSTYNLTFHGPSFRCRKPVSLQDLSSVKVGFNHGRLWVSAQNVMYDCVLTDTEYSTRFFYSTSEQAQRIDPEYSFKWTEEDVYDSYFYLADALATLLGGAVRVFGKGIMAFKTRVTDTAIFGALNVESTKYHSPDLSPSVGELIEELSRNITLSVFSLDQMLIQNDTMVRISSDVNVYSYNRRVLIITYAVVFLGTLIALLIGSVAYFKNGVSHQLSFSTFMSTTRNYQLDELTAGSSMGAMPLRDSIRSTKLQFGFLRNADEGAEREELMRRVGFGLSDQIVPLQKGIPYY
ncbi:hypothetical protein CI102_7940 [Trichoderma harzianum]|nr:hypothetical protein CI102_7940 [Trichoderma harzianum]